MEYGVVVAVIFVIAIVIYASLKNKKKRWYFSIQISAAVPAQAYPLHFKVESYRTIGSDMN